MRPNTRTVLIALFAAAVSIVLLMADSVWEQGHPSRAIFVWIGLVGFWIAFGVWRSRRVRQDRSADRNVAGPPPD